MRRERPPVSAYDCAWPPEDQHAEAHITAGLPFLVAAIGYCTQHRHALQAGGCVGLHPLALAECFARVDTWEPSTVNLPYIKRNVAGVSNVFLHEGALTDDPSRDWAMKHFPANCGGSRLVPFVHEVVPMYRGDDYEWQDVDFVQLDTEGHELPILMGLEQTLLRCRPVVQIEEYGWGAQHFGHEAHSARHWLEARGWKQVAASESDRVLVHA